ncbi:MAG TPA: FecR domain-containing protein [Chitinophaga sp.]|uniref:FecR family protein n=1 Tax=Chitinophaga sp. TaxID=1869181 RepID=UPI002BE18DB0|nr:FecR domain-containing protein [Chitinophaga sp.]HVI44331.1 FecR domain-containing protein [Chitinophaga sp.]
MLNHRYIQFLLQKRQQGNLSNEEEQLLEHWYRHLDNMPAPDAENRQDMKEQSWVQLEALYQASLPVKRTFRWQYLLWPAAAAFLLVAGIRYLMPAKETTSERAPAWASLECPAGKRMKMVLPDGSVVWLNGGSRLHYNPDFLQQRDFHVENGEVFFEVAKDAAHPFTVHTRSLDVKVLGTAFNVAAYTKLKEERITVTTGSVQVTNPQQQQVVLGTNQQLIYNHATGISGRQEVKAAETDSWRKGDIYLTNVSLEELALRLENIYGCTVIFDNPALKHCVNSLHFNDKEPVTKVLDLLKLIDNISYIIKDKTIIISGQRC